MRRKSGGCRNRASKYTEVGALDYCRLIKKNPILFPLVFFLFCFTIISELSELRIKISQLQAKIEATNKEVCYPYYWLLF
jgi:hypothetical protein